MSTKWRKYKQTCFDVVFSSKNMLIYTCFPVFSPFPHHNSKGSITYFSLCPSSACSANVSMAAFTIIWCVFSGIPAMMQLSLLFAACSNSVA